MSGVLASTMTAPRSPLAAAAAPPAASVMVPLNELTDRSLESVLPSATVYLKTNAAFPVPLWYVAVALLESVSVGVPETTTASSQVTVMSRLSPIL